MQSVTDGADTILAFSAIITSCHYGSLLYSTSVAVEQSRAVHDEKAKSMKVQDFQMMTIFMTTELKV